MKKRKNIFLKLKLSKFLLITLLVFSIVYSNSISMIVTVFAETDYAVNCEIDPKVQIVSFEGWGTSLCWFANVCGGWSDKRRTELADLIFSKDKGLGLNIARYNIAGGENPDCNYNKDAKTHLRTGAIIPGYKRGENQDYDWSQDENQRWFLSAAKERAGNDFIAEAFSNSPPYWMTQSGCVSGADKLLTNNLKDSYYDDFANYLTEVVKHFRDYWGIKFRTLEPLNEPGNLLWYAGGRQEGCYFSPENQQKLIKEVYNKLIEKGIINDTKISAMDESSADNTELRFSNYDEDTKSKIWQINTHTYMGSRNSKLNDIVSQYNKKLWVSEFGTGGSKTHNHNDIFSALELAQRISGDFSELKPSAWIYWQVVEDEANMSETKENSNWGLIHADMAGNSQQYYITKQYYAFLNYTKFIRPGYKIIKTGIKDSLAAYEPGKKELVLVLVNNSDDLKKVDCRINNIRKISDKIDHYRTSETENLIKLSEINALNERFSVELKPKSINTFVVSNVEVIETDEGNQSSFKTFEDIQNSWAKNYIETLASQGIIKGISEREFGPDNNVTRADFTLLMVRALNINLEADYEKIFEDVCKSDYYFRAVSAASKIGLVTGVGNGHFEPLDPITRQDLMVITARALKNVKNMQEKVNISNLLKFVDCGDISPYAKDSISWLVDLQIVKGNNNMLSPKANTTRAETAKIIYSILELLK